MRRSFYFQNHDGVEVDLIVETASGLVAIEMKSSPHWERKSRTGLRKFCDLHPPGTVLPLGVYTGTHPLMEDGIMVYSWDQFLR